MKYTVIVAEDEELLLDNLCKKIEMVDSDFEVIGRAQTGSQAYELIEELCPDVCITDIRMPVMDGIALLKKVRERYPLTKCIITSGFSDFEYAKSAISLRVSDYLLKPIDPDELAASLTKIKKELLIINMNDEQALKNSASRMTPAQLAELIRDYLVENFSKDINFNQIAGNLNYSSSYLTKLFCQYYELSPSRYLINLRVSTAQKLLLHNPEMSIKQIGEQVGYHDQGYFSRIFKKYTGKSPFEYRDGENT